MTRTRPEANVHRFDGWEIRPGQRALLVDGRPTKIGSRAFDLLMALVARDGHPATKDELLSAAWPGLVVEENNLSVQITALRKAIGALAIVTVPGVGYRLASAAKPVDDTEDASARTPFPLPVRALHGRTHDLNALLDCVGVVPLLSIVGTGGVGKTALASALVATASRRWQDGVHWIDLAPVKRGSSVLPLVAKALGISLGVGPGPVDADAFMASIARLQAWIALDNCEHLVDEVACFVGAALKATSGPHWLVTSQVPLHLSVERVYRLEPLVVPLLKEGLDQALGRGSLALLAARATAANRHFALDEHNVDAAIDVCRQLDGLPLALEIAASRIAMLGLDGVRDQLRQRLTLRSGLRDTPDRQVTLQRTYEWSYGLLTPIEQRVFRRLEPFLGGFTAAMVPHIARCAATPSMPGHEAHAGVVDNVNDIDLLDALERLVDRSLVQRNAEAPGRFYLLESARDFARLCLHAEGESALVCARHAEAIDACFATAQADYEHQRDADWIRRYMPERHNVQAALAWGAQSREPDLLARIAASMVLLDASTQSQVEIVRLHVPLDVLERARLPDRARAFLEIGWAHYLDGNRETSTALLERALDDFDAVDDDCGRYLALQRLLRLCEVLDGRHDQAESLRHRLSGIDELALPLRTRMIGRITAGAQYGGRTIERLQELHDIAQRAGFDALAAVCRVHITDEYLIQQRFEEASDAALVMLEADTDTATDAALPRARALLFHNRALALIQLGRVDESQSAVRAMLRMLPSADHMAVDLFALVAVRQQRFIDAAVMAGYSAQVRRERGLSSDPAEAAIIAETLAMLRRSLASDRLAELTRLGAAMPAQEVLAIGCPI